MKLPLEDVKVLDLSHALAGPFCSTLLGDFGAQVVKIEVPEVGDIARAWGPPFYNTETAYFVSLHRNKKSIEIDLKREAGKELFFRLVEVLRRGVGELPRWHAAEAGHRLREGTRPQPGHRLLLSLRVRTDWPLPRACGAGFDRPGGERHDQRHR